MKEKWFKFALKIIAHPLLKNNKYKPRKTESNTERIVLLCSAKLTEWTPFKFEEFQLFDIKMFVTDIRKDFFDVLQHERILLIANLDVDAVCAVKILQTLLQCDNVQYTLEPVQGKADLIRAFEHNCGEDSGIRYAVLVNCGASVDLVDFLDPPEDLVIFVADSHRPIDVCNAYNDGQIRLLALPEDVEEIPKYEDVFRDGNEFGNNDNDGRSSSSESEENHDYRYLLKRSFLRIYITHMV